MEAILEAVKRDGRGKNEARRLRAAGQLPAVVYGSQMAGNTAGAASVSVDPRVVLRILRSDSGANTLINLKLDGAESRVMVREFQRDPITGQLLHADFYQLAMDKAITVTVPIVLKGEPRGVKIQGGMLDFVTHTIQVECLPADIPGHIDLDVSDLVLHQAVRVRDLPASSTWTPVSDAETMLVHIILPKAEESAAAAAVAEPEVIKKGKTEKDEDSAKK